MKSYFSSTWTTRLQTFRLSRVAGWGIGTVALAVTVGACLERPIEIVEPRTTSTVVERLAQSAVDKIDLLLVIDDSGSMADKQALLKSAVPKLVERLVNPSCVGDDGMALPTPASPLQPCAQGTREFSPIVDMHIGIISSSLGDGGEGVCPNGKARLSDKGVTGPVPTYSNFGYLVWDPTGETHSPPGEASADALGNLVGDMVAGVGEKGCGYEAPLEAWYRFLVDPEPAQTITVINNVAVKEGIDQELLLQRKQFLRPDSLLAIIMLTDENDCSINDGGVSANIALKRGDMPRATAICATNPTDACCHSCGVAPPQGCDAKPTECFDSGGDLVRLASDDDSLNARCFDNKRRFGIDFLQPTSRYIDALRGAKVPLANGELVDNPLFSDLNPDDDNPVIRDPSLVFVAGIVGVPWQLIARPGSGAEPSLENGYLDGDELLVNAVWPKILGEPQTQTPPSDPHMVESQVPRAGAGTYNGGDYQTDKEDLEYACIFPLATPVTCGETDNACDCSDTRDVYGDKPLCQVQDPSRTNPGRLVQTHAKAYPGLRQLEVLKGAGPQGITASVCPADSMNESAPGYGYNPAVNAIVDRLKITLGGQCLSRSFKPDATGQVSCLVVEASSAGACPCDQPGRRPADGRAVDAILEDSAAQDSWNCFCELTQASGDDAVACRESVQDPAVDGWCYIDATVEPPVGNPELVKNCPDTERRLIRFAGGANPVIGSTTFITCSGEQGN